MIKFKRFLACVILAMAGYTLIKSIFFGVPIERFANEIDDDVYAKIATAIENVVTLKGTFVSFKKETSFKNFNVGLFYDLETARKRKGKKLKLK